MALENGNPISSLKGFLSKPYALAMSPGFFRVYAHVGIMHSLEEAGLLHPTCVCGTSAGAMSAGFYASGLRPSEMIARILKIDREAIWDPSFGLGLLEGAKLRSVIDAELAVKSFEQCMVPCGMTAYDVFGMQTRVLHTGDIATNMCASACFPGLFQPVYLEGRPHIDGGVWDHLGMFSLPNIPSQTKLVLNVVTDKLQVPSIDACMPAHLLEQGAKLLTILVNGLGVVHPFNMDTAGRRSYMQAKAALDRALRGEGGYHMMALGGGDRHWVVYLDCGDASVSVSASAAMNAAVCTDKMTQVPDGGGATGTSTSTSTGTNKKAYKAAGKKRRPLFTRPRNRGVKRHIALRTRLPVHRLLHRRRSCSSRKSSMYVCSA